MAHSDLDQSLELEDEHLSAKIKNKEQEVHEGMCEKMKDENQEQDDKSVTYSVDITTLDINSATKIQKVVKFGGKRYFQIYASNKLGFIGEKKMKSAYPEVVLAFYEELLK